MAYNDDYVYRWRDRESSGRTAIQYSKFNNEAKQTIEEVAVGIKEVE